jgi:hypothetical protein
MSEMCILDTIERELTVLVQQVSSEIRTISHLLLRRFSIWRVLLPRCAGMWMVSPSAARSKSIWKFRGFRAAFVRDGNRHFPNCPGMFDQYPSSFAERGSGHTSSKGRQ